VPVISFPVIVTSSISPASTFAMKSLKVIGWSGPWKPVEKFQIRTPTTMRTIQKRRLLIVEFKQFPQNT
jgi:hypothetical protein